MKLELVSCALTNDGSVTVKFNRLLSTQETQTLSYQIQDFLQQRQTPLVPHCKTCQCARTDAIMPLDHTGSPRKRSWHHG